MRFALAFALFASLPRQEPRFAEKIEVARVVLDARVVDARGRPIPDLGPEDFRLKVDGRVVSVESAAWVAEAPPASPAAASAPAPSAVSAPRGRLIVLLFQRDIGDRRVKGVMRMKTRAAAFLKTLGDQDRVAVLLFDSHLRVFLDFTEDKGRVANVLERRLLHEWPAPVEAGPFPSLLEHLDRDAARHATSPETALLVVARALEPLPGAKSVLFFGWGLGRLTSGQVVLEPDYEPAREMLARARAAVFALDVSDADYHTLEVALEKVAEDTGGLYMKTHDFPHQAMALVEGALNGHYVLSFQTPAGKRREHTVSIELVGRKGTVLTRNTYVD